MTAAERATLSYSRSQMIAAILFGAMLAVLGWALVAVGIGYGVIILIPIFAADIAMYLIGYTMHTAAAETVTARHIADKLAIDARSGVVTTQTDDERRRLERDVLRWWSAGNPTTARATIDKWKISQATWESLRNRAIFDGLAHWADSPQGKQLIWQASQSDTIKKTA